MTCHGNEGMHYCYTAVRSASIYTAVCSVMITAIFYIEIEKLVYIYIYTAVCSVYILLETSFYSI